ncbi:MAG: hypothetical protein U1E87_09445 [Alphaproteobacteria bacterium]
MVRLGINLVHLFAHLSQPFIPETATKVHAAVNGYVKLLPWPSRPAAEELAEIEGGQQFEVPDVLFAKVEDAQVAEWEARFGGGEA